jgi:hypothetical protein
MDRQPLERRCQRVVVRSRQLEAQLGNGGFERVRGDAIEVNERAHRRPQPAELELPGSPARRKLAAPAWGRLLAVFDERGKVQQGSEQVEEDGVDRPAFAAVLFAVSCPTAMAQRISSRSSSTARRASSIDPSSSMVLISPGS